MTAPASFTRGRTLMAGTLGVALAVGLGAGAATQSLDGTASTLQDRLGLTQAERRTIDGGYESARLLPVSAADGIAAIGGVWIEARPDTYLRWAEDFADFDRGSSVQAVRRLSNPPVLSDFDSLSLSKEDLRDLSRCRIGACAVQLDAESIRQVAALDWKDPSAPVKATAIVRGMMLQIARRYTSEGNGSLPDYQDSGRPTDLRRNLMSMLDEEAVTPRTPPRLLAFLRHGGAPPAGATSYLYWTTNAFGLKPTTRLNHTVVYRANDGGIAGVIATKQLYASHYFHGGLDLRFTVANPALDDRFVLVMVTRSRSDGLTGFTGALLGARIRRNALHSLRQYLLYTKDTVEARQRRGSMP